ncbi:MAG: hypothetical protein WC838_00130 [Candidatus Margulisiibacteriota bacterium]|jgi:fibronectin type 3 domain-containing protein
MGVLCKLGDGMNRICKVLLISILLGIFSINALGFGEPQYVYGRVIGDMINNSNNLPVKYTLYMLRTPQQAHTELTRQHPSNMYYSIFDSAANDGLGSYFYNIGNLTTPWTNGDQAIVFYEYEENAGQNGHKGYAAVTNKTQNVGASLANRTFAVTTMNPLPIPQAVSEGLTIRLVWSAAIENPGQPLVANVIGYNLYRSTNQASGFSKINSSLITTLAYTDVVPDIQHTYYYVLKLVYRGNIEGSVFSGNSIPVNPLEQLAPTAIITRVTTENNLLTVHGTVTDDVAIKDWTLTDSLGNTLNSGTAVNSSVLTVNGILKQNWDISSYPEGNTTLSLLVNDYAGYNSISYFPVYITHIVPTSSGSGSGSSGGSQSHTVYGSLASNLPAGQFITRNVYLQPYRGAVLSAPLSYWNGVYYFVQNIANFPIPWEDHDDALVFYEYETDGGTSEHIGYYGVKNQVQHIQDNENNFTPTTLNTIPAPRATKQGNNILLAWNTPEEAVSTATSANIIGYNIYRSIYGNTGFAQVNSIVITTTNYLDINIPNAQATYYYTLKLVFRGQIAGNVFSENSNPVNLGERLAPTVYINNVVSWNNSVTVYGTVTDDYAINTWLLKDGQGNTLNNGTAVNSAVLTVNGILLTNWDTSTYPEGRTTLSLSATDYAGNYNTCVYSLTITHYVPTSSGSGSDDSSGGSQSHTVFGELAGSLPTGLNIIRNIYLQPYRGAVLSAPMSNWSGVYYFVQNIANFPIIWQDHDEAVVFYEYETSSGTASHTGYYGVNNQRQHIQDNENNFSPTTINAIPAPSAIKQGNNVNLSWAVPVESVGSPSVINIIGYNVYRSTNQSSGFTLVNTALVTASSFTDTTADNQNTYYYAIKLVYRGNIAGNVFSANSNRVGYSDTVAPKVVITQAPSQNNKVVIYGTVTDNAGINFWSLKDGQGNTLNSGSAVNNPVVTVNGILKLNWDISTYPEGPTTLSLFATDYAGNSSITYYPLTIAYFIPTASNSGGAQSHTVYGEIAGLMPTGLNIARNVYLQPYRGAILSAPLSYWNGIYYFVQNIANFPVPWQDHDEAVVFYEYETNPGLSSHTGFYGVSNQRQHITDNDNNFSPTTLNTIPVPLAVKQGNNIELSWTIPAEVAGDPVTTNIIGYNLYRSTSPSSGFSQLNALVIASNNYTDTSADNQNTYYYALKLVYRGSIAGNVYSANSNPLGLRDTIAPRVEITQVASQNEKVAVSGTITDNTGINTWLLKDGQGNTLNSGSAVNSTVVTVNGLLLLNWDISDYPEGRTTLSLSATDYAGNSSSCYFPFTVVHYVPPSSNSGGAQSHTVFGEITGTLPAGLNITRTLYLQPYRGSVLSSALSFWNGTYYFVQNIANFPVPWQDHDEAVVFYESETNSETAAHTGYYGVNHQLQHIQDNDNNFSATPLIAMPVPRAVKQGSNILLSWAVPTETTGTPTTTNIIGYNIYRSTSQASGFILLNGTLITATTYTDTTADNQNTYYYALKLVYRGNIAGNTFSANSNPIGVNDNIFPKAIITQVTSQNNKVAVYGTVTDNTGLNTWLLKDGSGNTLNSGAAINNTALTVNGILLLNWDTSDHPEGRTTLSLSASDYAGNSTITYYPITITRYVPVSSGGSQSHTVFGELAGTMPNGLAVVRNIYMQPYRGAVLSATLSNWNGTYYFVQNIANFPVPWQDHDEALVFFEYETNPGTASHGGFYGVNNQRQHSEDNDNNFSPTTLNAMPVPRAVKQGSNVNISWTVPAEAVGDPAATNIIGYNIYRSTSQASGFALLNTALVTATNYNDNTADNQTTYYYAIKLVYRGNIVGNVYSANSNPIGLSDVMLPKAMITQVASQNNKIAIYGTITDNLGIDTWTLRDGIGNILNSGTGLNSPVVTVNGTLKQNWDISAYPEGRTTLSIFAADYAGNTTTAYFSFIVTHYIPPTANVGGAQSHTTYGNIAESLPAGLVITRNVYMLPYRGAVLSAPLSYWNGLYYFVQNIANFPVPWQDHDEALVFYEYETDPGTSSHAGFYAVNNQVQHILDNDNNFSPSTLNAIPVPRALKQGNNIRLSWDVPAETVGSPSVTNIIGYNLYRSNSQTSGFTMLSSTALTAVKLNAAMLTTTNYTDTNLDAQSTHYYTLGLVFRGNIQGRVYSANSNPVDLRELLPPTALISYTTSWNNSLTVYGTVTDDFAINSWTLKDGLGNTLNSGTAINSIVLTVNGVLLQNCDISLYPEGRTTLSLSATDYAGNNSISYFPLIISHYVPPTSNASGGARSHTVYGEISNTMPAGLIITRNIYMQPYSGAVFSAPLNYWNGIYYFVQNIANFPIPWQDHDEAIVFYEYETNPGAASHTGYYGVNNQIQRAEDNDNNFGPILLNRIPIPRAARAGSTIKLQWDTPVESAGDPAVTNIIGYNIYRSTSQESGFEQLNSAVIVTTNYTDDNLADAETNYYYTLQLVFRGGISSKVFSANSNPVNLEEVNSISNIYNMPNPLRYERANGTYFTYELSKAAASVKIKIFNSNGELIKEILDAPTYRGFNSIWWNGQNTWGERIANDVYLYIVQVRTETGKDIKGKGKLAVLSGSTARGWSR